MYVCCRMSYGISFSTIAIYKLQCNSDPQCTSIIMCEEWTLTGGPCRRNRVYKYIVLT